MAEIDHVGLQPFNEFVESGANFGDGASCSAPVNENGQVIFENINAENCEKFYSKCGTFDFQGGAHLTQKFLAGTHISDEQDIKFFLHCAKPEEDLAVSEGM